MLEKPDLDDQLIIACLEENDEFEYLFNKSYWHKLATIIQIPQLVKH